jgi:hypothetical protein
LFWTTSESFVGFAREFCIRGNPVSCGDWISQGEKKTPRADFAVDALIRCSEARLAGFLTKFIAFR